MRPLRLLLLVALATFALLWGVRTFVAGTRIADAAPGKSDKGHAEREAGTATHRARGRARAEMPDGAPERARVVAAVLAAAPPTALPHSPGIDAGLQVLGSNARPLLDYKLALLGRVKGCLGDRALSPGAIRAFFHFGPAEGTAWTGTTVELLDVTGNGDGNGNGNGTVHGDDAIVSCLAEAHRGFPLPLDDAPAGPDFAWATTITLPIGDDFAVRFVKSDGTVMR